MPDRSETKIERRAISPMNLAASVFERVQIQSVILANFSAKRTPDADTQRDNFVVEVDVPRFGISKEEERGSLHGFLEFELKGHVSDSQLGETPLLIVATFVLTYTLESFEGLSDESLRAFAQLNG